MMAGKEETLKAQVGTGLPVVALDDLDLGHEIAAPPVEPGDQDYDETGDAATSGLNEVYYLHLDDKFEQAAAMQWLKKLNEKHRKAGKPEVPMQNLCPMIDLGVVSERAQIVVLARKGTSQSPIKEAQPVVERNDMGYLVHKTVPAAELAEEMKAYCQLKLKDYWSKGRTRFDSKVRMTELVSAIGAVAVPYTCKWQDSADEKTNRRNQLLWLGWC